VGGLVCRPVWAGKQGGVLREKTLKQLETKELGGFAPGGSKGKKRKLTDIGKGKKEPSHNTFPILVCRKRRGFMEKETKTGSQEKKEGLPTGGKKNDNGNDHGWYMGREK